MQINKYRNFPCDAIKCVGDKIPNKEIEKALETLKNKIRIEYAVTVDDYLNVCGRYDK